MLVIDIEGLAELEAEWKAGCDKLGTDLEQATLVAAKDGIESEQASHPYQDHNGVDGLTASAHAEARAQGSVMTWPRNYASYVQQGTSRARAFPFLPVALRTAENSLNVRAAFAAEDLAAKMNR